MAAAYASFNSPEVPRRELPGAVRVSVWTRHQREAVESGRPALYFFPQGFTERAMVFVSQGDNVWTVSVSPLTAPHTTERHEALDALAGSYG